MKKLFSLAILAITCQSCATLMTGTKQAINFSCDQSDATVYSYKYKNKSEILNIDKSKAVVVCKTPSRVVIKRRTKMLFVSKEGYKDSIIYCKNPIIKVKYADPKTGLITNKKIRVSKYNPQTNFWYFGNLIYGGFFGMCIDLSNGAYINLEENMSVSLQKKK